MELQSASLIKKRTNVRHLHEYGGSRNAEITVEKCIPKLTSEDIFKLLHVHSGNNNYCNKEVLDWIHCWGYSCIEDI